MKIWTHLFLILILYGVSHTSIAAKDDDYVTIVEKVEPAVLELYAFHEGGTVRSPFLDEAFRDFFGLFDTPRRYHSSGAGSIIQPTGLVLTAAHVVQDPTTHVMASQIIASLKDGRLFKAKVIACYPEGDLALLQLILAPSESVPYINISSDSIYKAGQRVLAFGNPFQIGGSVSQGIISSGLKSIGSKIVVQTDAAANPGNSGGPLIDMKAEIVGVVSAILSRTGASHGISFAVPVSMVKILNRLIARKPSPWIGLSVQDQREDCVKNFLSDNPTQSICKGVAVAHIEKGSPAEKAELKIGDIILSFNGIELTDPDLLAFAVQTTEIGQHTPLIVLRDKKETKLTMVIGKQESENEQKKDRSLTGEPIILKGEHPLNGYTVSVPETSDSQKPIGVIIVAKPQADNLLHSLEVGDMITTINGLNLLRVKDKINQLQEMLKIAAQSGRFSIQVFQKNGGQSEFSMIMPPKRTVHPKL